jgi:hypothetical protein
MRLRTWRTLMTSSLGIVCLLGCGDKSAIHQQIRDPLLITKKPVEGPAQRLVPTAVAYAEPAPPQVPEAAVATAPVKLEAIGVSQAHADGGPSKPGLNAVPAVRTGSAAVPTETVSRRDPASIYGHAPDHSWLQGVIDKHYLGHLNLRYCDPSEEDEWGGKVILVDDPRLAQFKDGDVVRVEGEIVREAGQVKRGTWNHFAQYRLKNIRLIQSK